MIRKGIIKEKFEIEENINLPLETIADKIGQHR